MNLSKLTKIYETYDGHRKYVVEMKIKDNQNDDWNVLKRSIGFINLVAPSVIFLCVSMNVLCFFTLRG